MFTKYDLISALAIETVEQITQNEEEWSKYLTCAGRLYEYPFHEQLLIYAQKPYATVCESLKTWNDKMFCWVNKGAKGIALLNEESPFTKLKYVFDVSDVHAAKRIGRIPKVWKLKTEQRDLVLKQLEKSFGKADHQKTFEQRIIEMSERLAKQQCQTYLSELLEIKEGSSLSQHENESLENILQETLSASVSFTILSRCGADMDFWIQDLDFRHVCKFNTVETLAVLGNAAMEICEPILKEIQNTIDTIELTKFKESHDLYTKSLIGKEKAKKAKGEKQNETEIREKGRLSVPQAKAQQRNRTEDDGAEKATVGISKDPPPGNLSGTITDGKNITSGHNVQKSTPPHSVKQKIRKLKTKADETKNNQEHFATGKKVTKER